MDEPGHAVSYGRSSSAKQKSIDEQLADNRAACDANGWRVVAELSDPISASRYATKVRENWATLLEMLPKVDAVVLWEPSRGDRDLESWAGFLNRCRLHSVLIHAVSHGRTYDPRNARDYRSLAEDGVDSAYESDKISARVRRGHAASAVAGRPHAPVTYGYLRRYDPETREFIAQVEHPEQADVVRDIIGSIAARKPLHAICVRLNRAGVPTPRGARAWRPATLHSIALNPAFRPHPDAPEKGCRSHLGELYPGQWPPLVDEATWQEARRVLGANSEAVRKQRRDSAPGKVKYLLSGNPRIMQAPCGAHLVGFAKQTGRSAQYSCDGDRCASAPMADVDQYVTELVIARLARNDARVLFVKDDTAAEQAAEELARLEDELATARASFAAPHGITAESMAAKERAMAPAIEDARKRAQPTGTSLALLKLIDAAEFGETHVRPAWDDLPLPAKREVISTVFRRLVLGPATERMTRWTSPEERTRIVMSRVTAE